MPTNTIIRLDLAVKHRSGVAGLDLAVFLISRRCESELRQAAALVFRVERPEPVGVEVADHIADPVSLVNATLAIARGKPNLLRH